MEKFNLLIDLGNTVTVFGFFEGDKLIQSFSIPTHPNDKSDNIAIIKDFLNKNEINVTDGMIFSVVPDSEKTIKTLVRKYFGIEIEIFDWMNYNYSKKVPEIREPIGADLLADLVEANAKYGSPCLIVDLGTVTKLLQVNKQGLFCGLSIFLGMEGALSFFSVKAAMLPEYKNISIMKPELAFNTIDSMKHGVYWSTIGYIRTIYSNLRDNSCKIILTGGNSLFIKDEIIGAIHDPFLTLNGMNKIFREIRK